MNQHTRKHSKNQMGSSVLEFAMIVTFILTPLMGGVLDISKLLIIDNVLTRAAREGVVVASRGDDAVAPVRRMIEGAGLSMEKTRVNVSVGGNRPDLGRQVTVKLAYAIETDTLFPWKQIMPEGIVTMARARMEAGQ